jgi:hypothetical protein
MTELAKHASTAAQEGVTGYYAEHDADDTMCRTFLVALHRNYPHYSWFIESRGGVIMIRNFDISKNWCMVLHKANIEFDVSVAIRKMVKAAGEFLERANLKRGAMERGQPSATVLGDLPVEGMNRKTNGEKGEF